MLSSFRGVLTLAALILTVRPVIGQFDEDEDYDDNEFRSSEISEPDAGVVNRGATEGREVYAFRIEDALSGTTSYAVPAAKLLEVLVPVGQFIRRVIHMTDRSAEFLVEITNFHVKAKSEFRYLYRASQKKVASLHSDRLMTTFYENITTMLDDVYEAMEIETDLDRQKERIFVQTCGKYNFSSRYKVYRPLFSDNCVRNYSVNCLPTSIVKSQDYKKKNIASYAQHYKDLMARMQVMATLCAYGTQNDTVALDWSRIYMKQSVDIVDRMADNINNFINKRSYWLGESHVYVKKAVNSFKRRYHIAKGAPIPRNLCKALAKRIQRAIDNKKDYRSSYQVVAISTVNLSFFDISKDMSNAVLFMLTEHKLNVVVARHAVNYGRRGITAINYLEGLDIFQDLKNSCTVDSIVNSAMSATREDPILSSNRYTTMVIYSINRTEPNLTFHDGLAVTKSDSYWIWECEAVNDDLSYRKVKLVFML